MAKSVEQLAKEIMAECEADNEPITEAEALEMAKMELGAKEIKNYAQAETPKAKAKKERKVDNDKLEILQVIADSLEDVFEVAPTYENEVKLHFEINGISYTVNLVKHRPKK